MTMKDLLEKRAKAVAAMRAIAEKPAGADGDLSAEQQTQFDSAKAEAEKVEKAIERQRAVDDFERRVQGETIAGTGDRNFDGALQDFSLCRAILSQMPGHHVDTGRERELMAETARRAGRPFQGMAIPYAVMLKPISTRVMTTALPAGGPGSNLIATDYMGGQYIDRLRSQMVVRRLGARVMTGLQRNIEIPKLESSASVGWVAENSALTPSDQEHDKVQMAPKHAGGIVEFSRNLLMQTSPDIEALIRDDFAKVLAREVDRVAIKGGGSQEPEGIMATAEVDSSVSMATPSWEALLRIIEKVQTADAEGTAWATNPSVVRKLRSTVKVSSTDSVMLMQEPGSLAGYPCAVTTLVPHAGNSPSDKSTLIFGNWSDLIIGFWSELDILVNPYEATAFSKGNVQVRAMMTLDLALRHTESFAYADDVAY